LGTGDISAATVFSIREASAGDAEGGQRAVIEIKDFDRSEEAADGVFLGDGGWEVSVDRIKCRGAAGRPIAGDESLVAGGAVEDGDGGDDDAGRPIRRAGAFLLWKSQWK
jgi:hypothetical protein